MSDATALAAIDLYLDHCKDSDTVMLGFYGGEPLLNFDLIRQCCDYVKSRERDNRRHWDTRFSLTTNGTLLTDEVLEYLIHNNFSLSFSLDGPKEVHDRHRVSADGRGTFEVVFQNIQRIYRRYPWYFEDKVLFNCTVTPTANLNSLVEFFGQYHHLFTGGKLTLISLAPGNPEFIQKNPVYAERDKDWTGLYHSYCAAHVRGVSNPDILNPFIRGLFERNHLMIYKRPILDQATDQLGRINSCFPGARKLFVDVQGNLHVCERIDRYFPIGAVSSGFDVDRITALINEFISVMDSETCRNCWAVQMCNVCYHNGREGAFPEAAIHEECTRYREGLEEQLRVHCSILDENPSAFDYMESYEAA